jgi:hypothetical protein
VKHVEGWLNACIPPADLVIAVSGLVLCQVRVEQELKKVLSAEDAPATLRLLLHDAATYDVATETGGVNGSIVTR